MCIPSANAWKNNLKLASFLIHYWQAQTRRKLLKFSKKGLVKKCKKYKLNTKGSRMDLVDRLENKLTSVRILNIANKKWKTKGNKIKINGFLEYLEFCWIILCK